MIPKLNPPFATTEKKGLKIKPFRFLKTNSATTMPRVFHDYRPPKLKKTKSRWYVEYWFRVPELLKGQYSREWKRFRVFEDINRYKGQEKDTYASVLLKNVKEALEAGYNPFGEHLPYFVTPDTEKPVNWSLNTGLDRFIEYCLDKKLRGKTMGTYQSLINHLKDYFLKDNKLYELIESFTKDDIKGFFKSKRKDWENTTINNNITYINIFFNWFVKEEVIAKNPAATLEKLPTHITKHRYYSDELAAKLKACIKPRDPELYEFIQFIYYTATRPVKEARVLKNSHILFDRKLLFIPAKISKNKTDDYIPLGEDVLALLDNRKNREPDHYIFGGKKPRSENYFANHYKPFKEKFNLDDKWTIYGWKHSRAIHLAEAGADPYQIMRLFRHSSLEETMKYMRELGITDFKEIHEKTKKF